MLKNWFFVLKNLHNIFFQEILNFKKTLCGPPFNQVRHQEVQSFEVFFIFRLINFIKYFRDMHSDNSFEWITDKHKQ